jgi:hypothetical protein
LPPRPKTPKNQACEINLGSFKIVKDDFKLTHYIGYEQLEGSGPLIELYNIENNMEEMDELSGFHQGIASDLL